MAALASMRPETIPELSDDVPEDDPHVVKARLLANAEVSYIHAHYAKRGCYSGRIDRA